MAISLAKTVQGTAYTFYITTDLAAVLSGLVVVRESVYQSTGHKTDGFVPIIARTEVITDSTTTASINTSYNNGDYTGAIATAEAYLVASVAWYSGGSVV